MKRGKFWDLPKSKSQSEIKEGIGLFNRWAYAITAHLDKPVGAKKNASNLKIFQK